METAAAIACSERSRVLIAEGCSTSRMLEELILRRGGHEILSAPPDDQAASVARRLAPDLILLGLQAPGVGGLEVLKALKRSAETRNIPVIVLTTSADPAVYKAAAELGCAGFLTKPFQAETLLLAVDTNLAARGRTRAPKAHLEPSA